MRLADYVARFLADHGVNHVFMVTGGGAMHLNDAFGREERIQYICNHHEQASAMAADWNPGFRVDTSKIRSLGWSPSVSVEEGFRRTIRYYQNRIAGGAGT